MADTLDEAAPFWLSSEFFDDFLTDQDEPVPDFSFPDEFPYAPEIASDNKQCMLSTSPQSTLARASSWIARSAGGSSSGSPNAAPSPPTTPPGPPRNDAVGDLISRAVGQVTKLKLNCGDWAGPSSHVSFMGPPRSREEELLLNHPANHTNGGVHKNKLNQQKPWSIEPQLRPHSWPIHSSPASIIGTGTGAAVSGGGGAALRKGRAGTGVFLPRKYGNHKNNNNNIKNDSKAHPSDYRKKTGNSSPGYTTSNRGIDGMINGFAQLQPLCHHPQMGFVSGYDLLMARRNNAVMLHQQRGSRGGDYYLPQGWTS